MTLREKVGQLFVVYIYGDSASTTDSDMVAANRKLYGVDNGAQVVHRYHVGGIVYFTWANNLRNPQQIARLSNGLQVAAMTQRVPVPLQIGTDQEEGVVTRIGYPATVFPGNMALGATRNPGYARRQAAIVGQELRAMGINQDYAPVADVNTNPYNHADGTRSFGDNPGLVSAMTRASVLGFQQDANVTATAKHFPGLGSTVVNTDFGIAITHETRQRIYARDLPPFKTAISTDTDSIMVAHIVAPALDASGAPASLSYPIVTGILRKQLGYDGVVITDALSADALANIPPPSRAVSAIEAGDDELLMPSSLGQDIDTIVSSVRNGQISEQRLNESVYRILRLKVERGLFRNPYADLSAVDGVVGTPSHLAVAGRIANRSITLVKNVGGLLPLTQNSGKRVLVTGWGDVTTSKLAHTLDGYGVRTQRLWTGSNPSSALIERATVAARSDDLVVVLTSDAWDDPGQQRLVEALVFMGKPVVVVGMASPYDIAYFTNAPAFVVTYSYQDVSVSALARVLFGKLNPGGKLPVTVPVAGSPRKVLYPFGYGLSYSSHP